MSAEQQAKQKRDAAAAQRTEHDRRLGDLVRQCPSQTISTENDITSMASFFVFAHAMEQAMHAVMWHKVSQLSSPADAHARAYTALMAYASPERPGAHLLQQIVHLAEQAIGEARARHGQPTYVKAQQASIALDAPFMRPPPVPTNHPAPQEGGHDSGTDSGSPGMGGDADRGAAAAFDGPRVLPIVQPLEVVPEGGDGTPLIPPVTLSPPPFDAARLVMEPHDCFFNYLRYTLGIVQGHPLFR